MDPAELRQVLSAEGLALLGSLDAGDARDDVVRSVTRLRAAGHPPELVAAVLTQARLRRRARAKFGAFADRMLFTPDGLEQATRLRVAALHAGRFARAGLGSVADLGCGIGGDAMALAGLDLEVLAVERDEATAAVAAHNLAPFPSARVELAAAEDVDLSGVGAVWADPARRSGGRRRSDPADWSPPLPFLWELARRIPLGAKLAPGTDHSALPPDAEWQWVSDGRELVEVAVWTGPLARSGVRRAALVISDSGAAEITSGSESPDAPTGDLGAFLYEPDPAVIRSRLIGDLARSLDGRMLDPTIAWITSDSRVETPFAQRFEVAARLPLDERTLRRELRSRGIGTLEIKVRGVDVDPARFRTRLALRGEGSGVLVLTRAGSRRIAVLAER